MIIKAGLPPEKIIITGSPWFEELVKLFKEINPRLVINVALPYQDLTIMDACIKCGVDYLDTANYEHPDEAKFEYKEQWARDEAFKKAGIIGLLGSGFDPGVTGVFCAYAEQNILMRYII